MGIQGFSTKQAGEEFIIFKLDWHPLWPLKERMHLPDSIPHKELYNWKYGFVVMVPRKYLSPLLINGFISLEAPIISVGTCDSKTRRPFVIKRTDKTKELGWSRSVSGDKALKIIPCNPEKVWYDMERGLYFILEDEDANT